jgi:hypothetical protein
VSDHWLNLPKREIPKFAQQYADMIETAATKEMCRCGWIMKEMNGETKPWRQDEHPWCPVHTKVGFILGFYEWMFKEDKRLIRFTTEDEPKVVIDIPFSATDVSVAQALAEARDLNLSEVDESPIPTHGHANSEDEPVPGCSGCYKSLSGWWCDNCDQWPCTCTPGQD